MTRLGGITGLVSLTALLLAGCGDDGGDTRPGADGGNGTGDGGSGDGGSGTGATGDGGGSGSGGTGDGGSGSGGTGDGTGGSGDSGSDGGSGDSGSGSDGGSGDSGSDGGSGDSGSGSSDSGSAGTGIIPCDTASATLEPLPPNIYLVLDKSGSMVNNFWDHDGMPATPDETRWYGLFEVVEFVLNTFDTQINFGAILFPKIDADSGSACSVNTAPIEPVEATNAADILAAIPPKDADGSTVVGATPTRKGLEAAYSDLNAQTGGNPPAVVLITDGAANCPGTQQGFMAWNAYDDGLLAVVQDAWNNDAIPTYVIGIDISTMNTGMDVLDGDPDDIVPYDKMDELAQNGGRPNPGGPPAFYDTTNGAELQAALQQIIDDSLSCVVDLDPPAPFPDLIEIEIDGMMVPEVTDCATEDGWVWVNSPDQIELCGTACDDLQSFGNLDAKYFCEPG